MDRRLRVLAGPHAGNSFQLPETGIQLIGRSHAHNDICLSDPRVARVHCEVEVDRSGVVLRDCDSAGGTFVNAERVKTYALQHGDVIRIGDTRLAFQDLEQAKTRPPAPAGRPASPPPLATEGLSHLAESTLGPYQLGPALGAGHSGLTFRARDLRDRRVVALKVLHPVFPKNEEERQRFTQAMQVVLPLRHPHLVTVYEVGQTGPYSWVAQEYIEGESLTQMLLRNSTSGPPEWPWALRLVVHAGRALHHASRHRFVHCNITPQNILIRGSDHLIKLNDMALGRALAGSQLKQVSLRSKVQSDVAYLSPEQTRSHASLAASTDIFSLGSVVYALLTGRAPFAGKSVADTIARLREAEPARPKDRQPSLPELFWGIIRKMLAKQPEQRFQTAGELLAELARIDPDPA
jgi:serine/threonine-protein kinase